MTRRTLNFTGRKRIAQKNVSISVDAGYNVRAEWELEGYQFPADSRVYVEAIATSSGSPVVLRFPFGTIGAPSPPAVTSVKRLAGGSFAFNLKIVDESDEHGRLLGVAENIRALGDEYDDHGDIRQQALLPVMPTPLDSEVWRLTFAHSRPWLEVNVAIPDLMVRLRTDPVFFALVYPAVVREILARILIFEEFTDVDTDPSDWRSQWLRWGIHWHPDRERPAEGERNEHIEIWTSWIGTVVSQFCRVHDVAGKYANGGLGERS